MPVMEGVEVTRTILRHQDSNKESSISTLTANMASQVVDIYWDAGMDGHLGKPYRKAEMTQVLQAYLASVGAAQAGIRVSKR